MKLPTTMGMTDQKKWVVSATSVSTCLIFLIFLTYIFFQTIDFTAPLRVSHQQTVQDSFSQPDGSKSDQETLFWDESFRQDKSVSNLPPSPSDHSLNSSSLTDRVTDTTSNLPASPSDPGLNSISPTHRVSNMTKLNPPLPDHVINTTSDPASPPDMHRVTNTTSIRQSPEHDHSPRSVETEPAVKIICPSNMTFTCPVNYPLLQPKPNTAKSPPTCPDYFRWIHEDMKPWKKTGITRKMIEDSENKPALFRSFRLIIVNGTAYIKQYAKCYQTRDGFTIWGILQLLKLYPGQIPDLDLMFQCNDVPSVEKSEFPVPEKAPPLFHYCGSDDTYDIVFPDWSFWGWPEINIKPWVPLEKDLEQGNKMMNWTDREPFAYWRGNTYMGSRNVLNNCNSREKWNAIIHHQNWDKETREGFKSSDMSKQCRHRYKIYMEGIAWSVSEKYILACDSMTLLVTPIFYEFFTRTLIPMKHYWPINPNKICESVKFAVDWGNHNPKKAQEIGRDGSRFVREEILMRNVYDYMFHVLSEYAKLLVYRPTVPEGAVKLCSEKWVCPVTGHMERKYKMETTVEDDGEMDLSPPCGLPPPFEESELRDLSKRKMENVEKVERWTKEGRIDGLDNSL